MPPTSRRIRRAASIPLATEDNTNDSPTYVQDTSWIQLSNERDRRYVDQFASVLSLIDANDRRYTELRAEQDLRLSQRYEAQQQALRDALAAAEKAVNTALAANDKALTLAQDIGERWRQASNEWRGAMSDREKDFVSRNEAVQSNKALEDKVALLMANMNMGVGRGDNEQIRALGVQVAALTASMHEGTGRFQNRETTSATTASIAMFIIGLVGVVAAIIIGIVR